MNHYKEIYKTNKNKYISKTSIYYIILSLYIIYQSVNILKEVL